MPLKNVLRMAARIAHRASFLSMIVCLPLLASTCMVWPGLTAVLLDRPDKKPSSLPLLLALLGGGGGAPVPCWQTGQCWIFSTTTAWTSGGGLAGADAFCQNAASGLSLPGDYKALLMTEDLSRDITHNWVLYPNLVYISASNGSAIVGTTDAQGIFTFPLTSAIGTGQTWTGVTASWGINTGNTCTNWTQTVGLGGASASADVTFSSMIFNGGVNGCGVGLYLYCVQQ